jgi:tRNA (adenine-N(1)-)-methyltransferase non-catalytic subunit
MQKKKKSKNLSNQTDKTEYSQKKYIKKKAAKFMAYVRIDPVSIANVCQHYFAQHPQKICFLRPDSLARMVSLL